MRSGRALLTCGFLLFAGEAFASSDYACEPHARPASGEYADCDNSAMLAPGNDTRVNFALLLADRHGAPVGIHLPKPHPDALPTLIVPFAWSDLVEAQTAGEKGDADDDTSMFAQGEGTTCVSDAGGRADFLAALKADASLREDERTRLADARTALVCQPAEDAKPAGVLPSMQTDAGKQFQQYLSLAGEFYAGSYKPDDFAVLARGRQAWVREAAKYMVGRSWALLAQQNGFGEYGELDPAKMDRKSLANATGALNAYIKAYPKGRYIASAYGLLRRVAWLGGDTDALAAAYRWQIEQTDAHLRNLDDVALGQEIDAKFPFAAYSSSSTPSLLIAVDDLRRMRREGYAPDGSATPTLTRKELEGQKSRFSNVQALYAYLLAAYAYFVEKKPDAVLELLPAENGSKPLDTLGFSRQLLRALALDATGKAQARDAIVALFPRATWPRQRQTLELALAMHDERAGALDKVFAKDSLVQDAWTRELLLQHSADAGLLRNRVRAAGTATHEGAFALYVLLYKELTRGRYDDFLADLKSMPANPSTAAGANDAVLLQNFRWAGSRDGYACSGLAQVVAQLSKTPMAHGSRLCLAEFLRLNAYDHANLDQARPADEVGGALSRFTGKGLVRMDVYKRVIDDPSANANDKAYALYRAVYCFAPSGYNDCSSEDIPIATRKAWFRQLKTQYPNSRWANALEYYW